MILLRGGTLGIPLPHSEKRPFWQQGACKLNRISFPCGLGPPGHSWLTVLPSSWPGPQTPSCTAPPGTCPPAPWPVPYVLVQDQATWPCVQSQLPSLCGPCRTHTIVQDSVAGMSLDGFFPVVASQHVCARPPVGSASSPVTASGWGNLEIWLQEPGRQQGRAVRLGGLDRNTCQEPLGPSCP